MVQRFANQFSPSIIAFKRASLKLNRHHFDRKALLEQLMTNQPLVPIDKKTRLLNLLTFGYSSFIVLWVCAVCYFIGFKWIAGQLTVFHDGDLLKVSDFMHFYRGGRMILSPDCHEIYNPVVQQVWFNKLIAPAHVDSNAMESQWFPLVYLFSLPFTVFSLNDGQVVWDICSAVFGLFSVSLLVGLNNKLSKTERVFLFIGILASFPGYMTWANGHVSYLLLGVTSLYFYTLLTRNDLLSGFFLALIIKPQYLPFLGMAALVQKRIKLIGFAALFSAAAFILVSSVYSLQSVLSYPKFVIHVETETYIGAEKMTTIRSLLSYILPQNIVLTIAIIITLFSLYLVFRFWREAHTEQARRWAAGLTVVLALVASPHSFEYDCLMLSCPAALTLTSLHFGKIATYPKWFKLYSIMLIVYPMLAWAYYLIGTLSHQAVIKSALFVSTNLTILIFGCLHYKEVVVQPSET